MNKEAMKQGIAKKLKVKYGLKIDEAECFQVFNAISLTILEDIMDEWNETTSIYAEGKQAYYLSAEFLMGRALGNNLVNLGLYDEVKEVLDELNININEIEEIEEDAGLGNGGLGRLAACFVESAATLNMPLRGYGIRYSNGLFNQNIEAGFQTECEDNWLKYGDPWSVRKDNEAQIIEFADMKVKAIPYDTPIIGYGTKNVNTLRLWKCEAIKEFDFNLFNDQKYDEAIKPKNKADDISRVLYPNKFQNKTNGITPRRWIRLCNTELSSFITNLLGSEDWVKDLSLLKGLEKFANDESVLDKFMEIKHEKKVQLAQYIKQEEGIEVDPNSFFDIQIKRLHEYKRQFLNALYILDLYYRIKENPNLDIQKTTFIFGAKAFSGYRRAKAIIKFITEIGKLIDNDKDVSRKIKVVFVHNYRVSYAQKLISGSDLSKQISTAGKEASGTGNMKFMLNGTPTFGTLDGANVEIVNESGKENNFIFGLKVEDIEDIQDKYDSKKYYEKNPSIKRILDSLIDGTFDDGGNGDFEDLYNSLLEEGDQYYLLADFELFKEAEEKVFQAYKDKKAWAQKCFANICNVGVFSSDRTIKQYADEIWNIEPAKIE